MNDSLYSKKFSCPICGKNFSSLKAKVNACKVEKRDEDFCIHYAELNPLYYEIFVCPFCAYAAPEGSFKDITESEIKTLKEAFAGRVVARSFCTERSLNDAIATFKLAIYTAELRGAKSSILASLCLKLAWLYRFAGDDKEMTFLRYAYNKYKEAFDKEQFPIGNLNEISILYLLGELSRRLGQADDAVVWFSKAVASPERADNPKIEKLAREQWHLVKEQRKKNGKAV